MTQAYVVASIVSQNETSYVADHCVEGVIMSESQRRQVLRERVPLTDLVGDYVPLPGVGQEPRCLCPFHNDSRRAFEIDQVAKRFQCRDRGAAGDVVDFVRMLEGVTLAEALDILECRRQSDALA